GWTATDRTHLVCPCKILRHCPLLTSHTFTSPSYPPLIRSVLSRSKASDQINLLWPTRASSGWPSVTRQRRISPLSLPLATYCPLELSATDVILSIVSMNTEPVRSDPTNVASCASASCRSACQIVRCEQSLPLTWPFSWTRRLTILPPPYPCAERGSVR